MPVWLGASCVLALLGTSLFSQNVIAHRYLKKTHPSEDAFVLIAQTYDDSSPGLSGSILGDQGPSVSMVSYGTAGLAFSSTLMKDMSPASDNFSTAGLGSCDYTNCTYGLHSTLNICAKCADISDEIDTVSGRFVLRSDALSLDIARGYNNITSNTYYPDQGPLSAITIGPLIVHYLALAHDYGTANATPVAAECVAYWCVTTYDAWMENNVFYVTPGGRNVVKDSQAYDLNINSTSNFTDSGRTRLGQNQDIYIETDSCYLNNTKLVGTEECTFRVSSKAQLGLQNFLSEGYFGNPPLLRGSDEMAGTPDAWRTTSLAASTISSACNDDDSAIACTDQLNASLTSSFKNMATYMSSVVRSIQSDGRGYSYGKTSQTHLAFHIR